MSLYSWQHTKFGRTWAIEVLGSGTADDLKVEQHPRLSFVSRPTTKTPGVFPRQLKVPYTDRPGSRGYLSERLYDETLDCELDLDGSLYFKGKIFQGNRRRPLEKDEFSTSFTVSDGLDSLGGTDYDGATRTINEFLREVLYQTGIELPIHLYSDWKEDEAVGLLPDVKRITIGGSDSTYESVLKDFCETYGYQIFQDEGVWVVRQLSVYTGDGITRWEIATDGAVAPTTDNSVEQTLSIPYESSFDDLLRGYGRIKTIFEFPQPEGGLRNQEFDSYESGVFTSWTNAGDPQQISESAGGETYNLARFDTGDSLAQSAPSILRINDTFRINALNRVQFAAGADINGSFDHAEIIFTDFKTGTQYWGTQSGAVQTTQTFIGHTWSFVQSPPHDTNQIFELGPNGEITYVINSGNGFPADFSGTVKVKLFFDSGGGNTNRFDFRYVDASIEISSPRFTRLVSNVESSLPAKKEVRLAISDNNDHYGGFKVEYYDGSEWLPSQSWGGYAMGIKRGRDELSVTDRNMGIIDYKFDFDEFGGMMGIYSYDGKDYLPVAEEITIGQNEVSAFLIEHTFSGVVFTNNQIFDDFGTGGANINTGGKTLTISTKFTAETNKKFNETQKITTTSSEVTGVITSIPIDSVSSQFVGVGDTFYLFDIFDASLTSFVLAEPQQGGDTSLVVESKDIGSDTIPSGSWVIFNGEKISSFVTRTDTAIRLGVRSYEIATDEDGEALVDEDGEPIYYSEDDDGSTLALLQEQVILKVQNNGKIAAIRMDTSAEEGSVIDISADQVNINNIVFDEEGGIIRTENYVEGESGWIINGAGDAEFNDVIVRGRLISGLEASPDPGRGVAWGDNGDLYISAEDDGGKQIYYRAPDLHRFMLGDSASNAWAISNDPRSTLHTGLQLNKNLVFNTSIVALDGNGLLNLTKDTNTIINVGSSSPGNPDTLNGFRWEGSNPPPDGLTVFLRAGTDEITINDGSENIKIGGNITLGDYAGDLAMMMFVENPLPDGSWRLINRLP